MKIAIMGFGVVGSGVGKIIGIGNETMRRRSGEEIAIKHILDLRTFPDSPFDCFTKDFQDILKDPEVGVVAEVMGGLEPAYSFTKQLLTAGKSVVTSNKELVAKHGTELLAIAREHNVSYLFEASVGGGIPIIRPLYSSLAANELTEVLGILNGTTNYILTRMIKEGATFRDALRGAQENGYAEKDPTADVEGHDTCRKIAILASLAFGRYVDSDEIPCEGITGITPADVAYAERLGGVVKLLGMAKKEADGVYARVCPAILPNAHPLAGIDDVFNGIMVQGDALGDVMFYGRGAGSLPTASAVVSDIIDCVKHQGTHIRLGWRAAQPGYLLDADTQPARFCLRLQGDPAPLKAHCDCIRLDGAAYTDEFAVVTPLIPGAALDAFRRETLNGYPLLSAIRMVGEA